MLVITFGAGAVVIQNRFTQSRQDAKNVAPLGAAGARQMIGASRQEMAEHLGGFA